MSNTLNKVFLNNKFIKVYHFAAQAGVRYSFENPKTYLRSNVEGLENILRLSKKIKLNILYLHLQVQFMVTQKNFPVKENFPTSQPKSLYAATKNW